MKNLICILIATFLISRSFAQIEKGNYIAGGSVGLSGEKYFTKVSLNPTVGYFVNNFLVLGLNLEYTSTRFRFYPGIIITTSFIIGPWTRIYHSTGLFGELSMVIFPYTQFFTRGGTYQGGGY